MATSIVASSVAAGSSQPLSVTKPTGTTTGDRVYFVISHNDETVTCADNNGSTPTTKQGEYQAQSGGSGGQTIFYRTAGSSEPSSYAFTLSSSQRWVAVAFTLRGMSASAFSVVPAIGIVTADTSPTCPGITTLVANEIVFAVASIDNAVNGTFTAIPAGYTLIQTENTQQPTSVAYKLVAAAGAEADAVFTKTSAGANGWYTLSLFSVAPASTASSWVGMYYAHTNGESAAQTLAAVQDLMSRGCTRFQCFQNDAQLITAVSTAGGKVWVELADSVFSGTSGYNSTNLATIVNATKSNDTVEGYFSNDECDLKGYSASVLQTVYTDFKALTSKPLALNIRYPYRTSGPNGRQYVDAAGPVTADIIMIDPYNIPYGNAASVGSETASTVAISTLGGRPVYTVIQSFSWGTTFGSKLRPDCYPTVQEMTDMGVLSREAGAANLWIYTWNGDVETSNDPMSNFNAPCYAALASITAAWVAVGHVATGFGRLLGFGRNRLVRTLD